MYPENKLSQTKTPCRITTLLIGLFLALAWASPAFSDPGKRANAEALTHSLVGLNSAYQKAAPAAKSAALQKLIDATVERQALLAELVETDPGAVLRVAIPERIRKGMPAEVQAFIEQRLEIEGELEVMYEDYADGSYRLRHTLKADGKRIALHFKSSTPDLLSDTPVKINGVLVDDAMAVASGEEDVLMLACCTDTGESTTLNATSEGLNSLGEQRTLVLLINFQDDPLNKPWTKAEVADVVFGDTNDFYLENSFGQTWLNGDTYGWYTIPVDSAGCDLHLIVEQANQSAAINGIDLASYQRIAYFHPLNGCGWSGVATLSGGTSVALMNGTLDRRVVGHEFGHTLGLAHAHGLECGNVSLGPDCRNAEYADSLDIMGARIAHFNAFHKQRLGWLDTTQLMTVETSGSYVIEPYAAPLGAGPKALRILKNIDSLTGLPTWYYVEYRQAQGFDSIIATDPAYNSENILNGVVVRTGAEFDYDGSNMLDMTPGSDLIFDWFDSALTTGLSYSDVEAGITIMTEQADAVGAVVSVTLEPQAPICVPANPILSLTPGEGDWVRSGTSVNYSVTVTNHDSADCSANTFNLEAAIASGWNASFSPSALTVEPGASASANLTVSSPLSAADGFYTIGVSTSNSNNMDFSATGSVTYVVSTPAEPTANNPPVAVDDSAILLTKSAIEIEVLVNDSDLDADPLNITAYTNGAKGRVSFKGGGKLTYTPGKNFKSNDSFTYTISDGLEAASATVSVMLQSGGGGKGKPRR